MVVSMGADSRLLLVDGLAGAYRFFHAIRGLQTASGVPVNAVYGFIRMMDQLARTWQPTHIAVVFDGGTPPARLALVPDYKANRKPMPDELKLQLPILNEYLDAAGIESIRLDACEADDVIATLAKQAEESGSEVLIATGDKDLYQLVDAHVRIVSMAGEPAVMDAGAIQQKTGVRPEQIPDWLAMIGDAADNIKGVSGVGPKTAAKLLSQYDDMAVLYRQIDSIDNAKLRTKMRDSYELVERNLKMVRLDCRVAGVPDWQRLRRKTLPVGALIAFYRRYEFTSFANRLISPELF